MGVLRSVHAPARCVPLPWPDVCVCDGCHLTGESDSIPLLLRREWVSAEDEPLSGPVDPLGDTALPAVMRIAPTVANCPTLGSLPGVAQRDRRWHTPCTKTVRMKTGVETTGGFERLSALDASFLSAESDATPMHIGAVQLFEAGSAIAPDGAIDLGAFRCRIASVLHLAPRCRQRLAWTPVERWPVWIDDPAFDVDQHVRCLSLARPGTVEQLNAMAAWLLERPLDRSRPLWEMWLVEGLRDGRLAVVSKFHHSMIDGHAGVELAQILLSPDPTIQIVPALPFTPRPPPSSWGLLADEWRRRSDLAGDVVHALRASEPRRVMSDLSARVRALVGLAAATLRPTPAAHLHGIVTPKRRFATLAFPLSVVRDVKRAAGCTLNDVVLAIVAGAARRRLLRLGLDPARTEFRVAAPVDVRRPDDHEFGNRVSSWIVPLPVAEADPGRRLDRIVETTTRLKRDRASLGVETLMYLAEWLPTAALSAGSRLASAPIRMIVTNVPGPPFPLYSLGARLEDLYPVVPLMQKMGLGIALFSYDGTLFWGFNASWDLVPDLDQIVEDVRIAFADLATEHGVEWTPDAPAPIDLSPPSMRGAGRDAPTQVSIRA